MSGHFSKLCKLGPGSDTLGFSKVESLGPASFLLIRYTESLKLKSTTGCDQTIKDDGSLIRIWGLTMYNSQVS